MSNSNAGITLTARTAEFEAKLNRAISTFEKLSTKGASVSKAIDKSFKTITLTSKNSARDIEKSFNALSIKSDFSLNVQAKALERNAKFFKRQYYKIKLDGTSSAKDITRAYQAMNIKLAQLSKQSISMAGGDKLRKNTAAINDNIKKSARSMNLFNLASIASILKIQIMFTLVNNLMSSISNLPGIAFEAIESFNAASISNAAIITSMQISTRNVGVRYKENLAYAKSVNKELIKMDAHTAASFTNLSDMNRQFVNQGILLDANNKKQIEGFTNIANALAVLTAGSPNQAQQYTQEVKSLLKAEKRPGNVLFDLLNNLDNGNLKEHLALWKKTGEEMGNAGYILEQLNPLLVGFTAAQGDIDALWSTIKATMITIRDEILREGFTPEFELIVKKMRELGTYAKDNKEKIASMMRGGFESFNKILTMLPEIAAGIGLITLAQIRWNKVALLNPYVRTLVAIGAINEALKYTSKIELPFGGKMPDMSFGGMLGTVNSFVNNIENIVNSLRDLRPEIEGVSGALAQSHITPSPMWAAHGETMLKGGVPTGIKGKSSEVDEKAIRAAERLKNRLIEIRKSENDIFLTELESTSNLAIAVNESKYKLMLISDKNYLDKKHELLIASAEREISSKQLALNEAIKAKTSLSKDVPNRLLAEAKLTLKVNRATIELTKSKDALRVLNTKTSEESGTLFLKQIALQDKLTISEINSKIKMVSVNEKLFKLTSGEAASIRINLLRERLSLQANALSLNLRLSDSEQARYTEQLIAIQATNNAIRETNNLLSDQTAMDSMFTVINEYRQVAEDMGSQMKDMFTNVFSNMEDAMVSFVETGKLSFSSLADAIIEDLIRIHARQVTSNLLGAALSFGTSLFTPAFNAPGSAATGFYGPMPPGRAAGGPVNPGQTYVVGEEGPELLHMGSSSGFIDPNGGSGGGSMVVNIINNGNADVTTEETQLSGGGLQLDVMIDDATAAGIRNYGKTYKAIGDVFGIKPAINRR